MKCKQKLINTVDFRLDMHQLWCTSIISITQCLLGTKSDGIAISAVIVEFYVASHVEYFQTYFCSHRTYEHTVTWPKIIFLNSIVV